MISTTAVTDWPCFPGVRAARLLLTLRVKGKVIVVLNDDAPCRCVECKILKLTDPGANRYFSPGGRAIVAGGFSRRFAGSWTFRPEGGRIGRPPSGRKSHKNTASRD